MQSHREQETKQKSKVDRKIFGSISLKDLATRHPRFSPSSLHISKKGMIVSSESWLVTIKSQTGKPGRYKSNKSVKVSVTHTG